MTAPIVFEKVTKAFGDETIVDALDWTLPARGTLCLFGPSGCGKTTLLHLLAGIHTPDAGRITGLAERTVSVVFQEPRLLPWLSALHNITAVMHSHRDAGAQRDAIAQDWLMRLGLEGAADKLPDELSGGMRQRVAIARALAFGGDLLLLDEPTQGLDVAMRDTVLDLLRENGKERLTLLVTHDPEEAERMGSTVIQVLGPPVRLMV